MKKIKFVLRYFYHKLFSGFYHLGGRVLFEDNVKVTNPNFIYLGNGVSLNNNCEIGVIKDNLDHFNNTQTPILEIEDGVGISKGAVIVALKCIQIKKNTMIGPYCFIADYDHSYQDVNKPIVHQPLMNINPVVIEEGVWIGAHVSICSGVTIGKNSVIGAGSVVTKNIPSYSVAVGVPAKIIKKYNFKIKCWEKI